MITTLPISISQNPVFEKILSPFVAWLYASSINSRFILSLNLIGNRLNQLSNEDKHRLAHKYVNSNNLICGIDSPYWMDDDVNFSDFVQNNISGLKKTEKIVFVKSNVLRCECGAVEIIENAKHNKNAKTYSINPSGQIFCRLCDSKAVKTTVESLLFKRSKKDISDKQIKIFPNWMNSEVNSIWDELSSVDHLISRSKRISSPLNDKDTGLDIDTDFFWSFFIDYLTNKNPSEPITIITSNRTIKQAINVIYVSRIIGIEQPINIIVHPTITIQDRSNSRLKITLDEFARMEKPEVLRCLLTLGLCWGSKETKIPSSQIYWIKHSINPKETPSINLSGSDISSPDSFMRIYNQNNLNQLITSLRKRKGISREQSRLYQTLF